MKIKYDKRTCKILIIILCVSGILFLIGLICLLFEIDGTESLILIGLFGGGGLLIYSGLNLVESIFYMRRLRTYGYEIPNNKKDYKDDINNVPISIKLHTTDMESKESKFLSLLYLFIFIFANLWNVYYMARWHGCLKSIAIYLLIFQMVFDLYWLISAFLFYKQRNNCKYRDDVERDTERKERTSIEKGLFNWVIMLVVMILIKTIIANMSDYMFHSRQEHDQYMIEMIQKSINAALCEMNRDETFLKENYDSYNQMINGCYISGWSAPQDDFARAILEIISISSFSELNESIYTSDGDPIIYVRITNGQVYVRMENPIYMNHGNQHSFEAN